MKKKAIITISIFLTIAVISVGLYFFSLYQGVNNITNQSNTQLKETTQNVLLPVKKLNCDDITGVKEKENCQAEVIKLLNSESSSVCDGLITEADKNTCRQSYVIKDAADSGDLDKCNNLTDKALSTNCLAQASFSLAVQKKDKKYCENIINKTDKENCFKVLAGMGIK